MSDREGVALLCKTFWPSIAYTIAQAVILLRHDIDQTDVIRWVGVVTALVGSAVVAPDGIGQLVKSISSWLKQGGNRVRGRLTRWLPFLAHDMAATVNDRVGTTDLLTVGLTETSSVLKFGGSIHEQIWQLRERIGEVDNRIAETEQALNEELQTIREDVKAMVQAVHDEATAVKVLLESLQLQSARIDARGLPLIGVGILLSGVPEDLARLPFGLSWALPLASLYVVGIVTSLAIRDHGRLQLAGTAA